MFSYDDEIQRKEDFINNYEGESERSVISAYKSFLENGLGELLNWYGKGYFENGQFNIGLYFNKIKFPGLNFDDVEEKKFLVMDVSWHFNSQKQKIYEDYVEDYYVETYELDNDTFDIYDNDADDTNDVEYYQQKARELESWKECDNRSQRIYCCELYDYKYDETNSEFEKRLIGRIKCFFNDFIDEVNINRGNQNSISVFEKIRYDELLKAREEELARINAKILKRSR